MKPRPSTSTLDRVLGGVGIAGGAALLSAFVVGIHPNLNPFRLALFNAGAIAVVLAVSRRQAAIGSRLALGAAAAAILANVWYLAMGGLAHGRPSPFSGDFGFIWFLAAAAMWLADSLFGVVTVRIGGASRWGALALAIGSALAFLGMDRLALTSAGEISVFGRLALIGIALNGIAWIVLGLELVARRHEAAGAMAPA